jgi:anti-sigma-K factor RskA
MTTTDIHTLAGAYALDAVDDIERASFDGHLRECAACRTEVDELLETAVRLADATWSVPPPRLRQNVLAEVARTRQLPPVSPPPPPARRRAPSRWLLTAAASVVVAAAAAGTTVYIVQDQRVRDERAIAEAARSSEARVREILAAPDVQVRETTMTGGGRVTVASSRLRDAGVVVMAADAAPTGGQVYQLWTIRPGSNPKSEVALRTGQSAALKVVDGLPGASDVAVTVEPAGGSLQPTTTPVAQVPL